ncbi:MAG: LemA family protein [candidate division WOR-3 bacterium]|nr:LemA family protein [candidate division WOR-3 bacterium]MCX7947343.1 LemA family protein [candidate division WOR-3 bacterium]MDW8150101.1 LemA family protein [candidate division WOR-3 bacterium]
MRGFLILLGFFLLLLFILIFPVISFYNGAISKREAIKNQFSQIDVVLKRRYDLIPNLIQSVKGVAIQEQEVFLKIAEARTKYGSAITPDDKIKAANELEGLLSRLLVIVENYPQLRSSESFLKLMDELAGTENRISVERRRYNELVREYNTFIKTFPNNMLTKFFGFSEAQYLETPEAEKEVPKVNFEDLRGGTKK